MLERLRHMLFFLSMPLYLAMSPPVLAAPIDLSVPVCPAGYALNGSVCKVADETSKLKGEACTAVAGFAEADGSCKPAGAAPAPECRSVAAGTLALKDGKCLFDSQIQASASGDYVGDYFKIVAVPLDGPNVLKYQAGTVLKVLSQQPLGQADKLLMVAAVKDGHGQTVMFRPELEKTAQTVKASDLIEYGADRIGWTYGALAIPYKYYASGKNFGTGVSIGPYVGRRWGRPGSAYTIAIAAAIGNVKGEVRDADNKVTSNPDLMAYSFAGGAMWDISKAQGVKPFKMGIFTGKDIVGSDDVVKFKHNRKWWVALQLGFDFTDN